MADGTPKKWTDEERNLFLTQAIGQMHARGGTLDLALFSIPNRTPKALSHLWAKVRKDNEAYTKEFLAKTNATATPGGTKRKAAVAEGDNEEPATPIKRPRKTPAKPRAKKAAPVTPARAPAVEEEGDAAMLTHGNPDNAPDFGSVFSAGDVTSDEI
ncbi:hypothetical protein GGR58DRAFT_527072 [Xylaria digitata]|nr:hypothetical protein GGR58DRAFT_527072 [Xylaria digitata]